MNEKHMERQLKKREQIINGGLWKTLLVIALPILFYNLCNYLYGIYDMIVVERANIGSSADIVVLDQIKHMISTIGGALACGGGILISRVYGSGETTKANKISNTLFTLGLIVSGFTLIFIPIGKPFLLLLKTDKTTIESAMGYYYVQIIILLVVTINSVFIAIEKAKGNTFILMILNLMVIAIKIFLTTLLAFGPFKGVTVTWIAASTLIAQCSMMIVGLFILFSPKNILGVSIKKLNLNIQIVKTILLLSLPVFIGRFLFTFGKVFVNSKATVVYGKKAVGALGISNTIAGLLSNAINSFEDAGSTIISQNYGAKKGKRIVEVFNKNLIYIMGMSVIGTIVLYFTKNPIAGFFAGDDMEYKQMIVDIFRWECLDIVFMGLAGVGSTLFYGFGKTRITMSYSMATLFAFRIPVLLFLMHVVKMNYEACGVAMFISNAMSGLLYLITSLVFLKVIKKKEKYRYLFENETLI